MSLTRPSIRSRLVTALGAVVLGSVWLSGGETTGAREPEGAFSPLPLKVRFWADEIELTGAVPDQKSANRLRIAIDRSHPGRPVRDRLVIDPARTVLDLPDSAELAGLLLELALSTSDGSLAVTSDEIVVSGLTDSLVTHAAFEARLRPLAARYGGKELRNRICIVHRDDLEPGMLPRRPRPALKPRALEQAPVTLAEESYGPDLPQVRALPLALTAINARSRSLEEPAVDAPGPTATDAPTETAPGRKPLGHEPAEKIEFTMNSYLVGFDQFRFIDAATARIRELPESAGKVILRGFPDTEGRHEFNDWLSVSRVKAVRRAFLDAGIPEDRFTLETHDGRNRNDELRSVRVLVPRLPEPGLEDGDEAEIPPAPLSTPASAPPEDSVTLSSPIGSRAPVAR